MKKEKIFDNSDLQEEEKTNESVIESKKDLPADYMENDPRYKEILEESSKKYLRSDTSSSGYMKKNGYSWGADGGVVDKEGNMVTASTLVGPSGIEQVRVDARNIFSEKNQNDSIKYEDKEKVRVYESPTSDPVYMETEREIMESVNSSNSIAGGQMDSLGDKGRIRDRQEELVSEARWGSFVSKYPEKAIAYAEKNEYIAKALKGEDDKKKYWEGVEKNTQEKVRIGIESAKNVEELISVLGQTESIQGSDKKYNTKELSQNIRDISSLVWTHIKPGQSGKLFEGQNPMLLNEITRAYGLRDKVQDLIEKEYKQREEINADENRITKDEDQRRIDELKASLGMKKNDSRYGFDDDGDIIGHSVIGPGEDEKVKIDDLRSGSISREEAQAKAVTGKEALLTSEDIIYDYLSYQDISTNADEKKNMLEYSLGNKSAEKYAEALEDMIKENSKEDVENLARDMKQKAKDILKKAGVRVSSFLESNTWAMWDLGKQFYFFNHQDEADKKYTIANPMKSPEKITEIIDRQIGWEIYHSRDKSFIDKFKGHPEYVRLQSLLSKQPQPERGDLSSKELAEIGAIIGEMSS